MPAVSGPRVARTSLGAASPAVIAQGPVLARCAAAMRGAVGVAGCAAAVLTASSHPLWWPAVVLNAGWTVWFVRTALRSGLTGPLVAGEVVLTGALCLAQRWVLPTGSLPDGVSWIAVILTSSMVVVNFAHPPRRAVPICLALLVAHLLGARWAGALDGGVGSATIHAIQIGSLALLMTLVRRAARLVDDVMAGLRLEQQVSAAADARRREEELRSDELHNKVLATLTVVATGGIRSSTPLLREQAAVAAQVLASLRLRSSGRPGHGTGTVPLAEVLASVAELAGLPVEVELAPVSVPESVAAAVAGAVEEALANVARHAAAGRVRLGLAALGADGGARGGAVDRAGAGPGAAAGAGPAVAGPAVTVAVATADDVEADSHGDSQVGVRVGVRVEVVDDGVGFDPAAVPAHRYGLRHAVLAAMRRVGGEAGVDSAPGRGTRVVLRWPA